MNIALWLERAARAAPDRAALGYGTQVAATYGAAGECVARLAAWLRARGLQPGDRVALFAKNSPDYFITLYAIWHAGLAAVPINAKLHGAEAAWIIENSGTRFAFVSADLETALAGHLPHDMRIDLMTLGTAAFTQTFLYDAMPCAPRDESDLCWLFYTSGTTGRPKGAMITHGMLAAATFAYACEVDPVMPGDSIVHAAPMSHGSGIYIPAHVMRLGVNVIPESGAFEPPEIFSLFSHWTNPSMFAAPTMIKRMVDHPADCDAKKIRTIIWGGAPMYVEDALAAIDRFGPRFAQIYGQGESPMTITHLTKQEIGASHDPRWLEKLGSAGRAYACVEVRVVDENDTILPIGEVGEIICRGTPVMPGYWENPDANAKTMRNGWLHTGDVGAFDAQGYLTLKDRSKDMIISGGSNIYPREVEEVLLAHDRVREVSVIGRPDAEWGEVVVAYVVGDTTPAELDALCLSRIARFKRPKDYIFLDALPKNNYGKILKTELRTRDAARQTKQAS
ncbi:MAG: AMP-binding protein [Beijerinckiaceae bacterium]